MLRTWEWGDIRIVSAESVTRFDTFLRQDDACEWNYYQRASGEIVAVENI